MMARLGLRFRWHGYWATVDGLLEDRALVQYDTGARDSLLYGSLVMVRLAGRMVEVELTAPSPVTNEINDLLLQVTMALASAVGPTRTRRLDDLVDSAFDYLDHSGRRLEASDVDLWAAQFDEDVQEELLEGVTRLLRRRYWSSERTQAALHHLIERHVPRIFHTNDLREVTFLNLHGDDSGQASMLRLTDQLLHELGEPRLDDCRGRNKFIYIDDAVFTGVTLVRSLRQWLARAPRGCELLIFHLCVHEGGMGRARAEVGPELDAAAVSSSWYSVTSVNDDRSHTEKLGILFPEQPISEPAARYTAELMEIRDSRVPLCRVGDVRNDELFQSPESRTLVEQSLLDAGVRLTDRARHTRLRPMGFDLFEWNSLGFGAFFVSFRKIANDCPIALWFDVLGWHPLFRRH